MENSKSDRKVLISSVAGSNWSALSVVDMLVALEMPFMRAARKSSCVDDVPAAAGRSETPGRALLCGMPP